MVAILDLYKTTLARTMVVQKHFLEYGKRYFDGWIMGPYNEQKYNEFAFLHSLPFVGDYMDYVLDKRKTEEYFKRYNMGYDDIHDPRKVPDFASTSRIYGDALQFVSDNVKKLYR